MSRHADFFERLGDRLLGRYSDGGRGAPRDKKKARAAKAARKRNRRKR